MVFESTAFFRQIASSYDLMNDLMSGGCHRSWKKTFIAQAPWDLYTDDPLYVVDVACGTGDITNTILSFMRAQGRPTHVWMVDPCPEMLDHCRKRMKDQGPSYRRSFVQAYGEDLPFPQDFFHMYFCSFGIRNVQDRKQTFSQAFRVLKPRGQIRILEFSSQVHPLIDPVYTPYRRHAIPFLGKHITGSQEAYTYLSESIEAFPSALEICGELSEAGFESVAHRPSFAGIITYYEGEKK